jgi:hypothetical protein
MPFTCAGCILARDAPDTFNQVTPDNGRYAERYQIEGGYRRRWYRWCEGLCWVLFRRWTRDVVQLNMLVDLSPHVLRAFVSEGYVFPHIVRKGYHLAICSSDPPQKYNALIAE